MRDARPSQRAIRKDEAAVSEIVGALLLVAIVSSAAFGFGVFLHAQAKATQEQQAHEQARILERLEVQGIEPVDAYSAACVPGGDGIWDSVTITAASLHLSPSRVETVRLNGHVVQYAFVDGAAHDASTDTIAVDARQVLTIELRNLDGHDAACGADGYSLYGTAAGQLVAATDAWHIEVLTARSNTFAATFVPPSALGRLKPVEGAADTFVLDGAGSRPGTDDVSIVSWTWDLWQAATCPAPGTPADDTGQGHLWQVGPLTNGADYCARLTVTDTHGLSGTVDIAFVG